MTEVIFTTDPTISFPESELQTLAKQNRIDPHVFRLIVEDVACYYKVSSFARKYDGVDTLDKLDGPAAKVVALLTDELNHHRVLIEMLEIEEGHARGDIREVAAVLDALVASLGRVRAAARRAHRGRSHGAPAQRRDLDAAYHCAVRHWIRLFGTTEFKNAEWVAAPVELEPESGYVAAWFLFDVMRLIDPERSGLGASIRNLMAETVKQLPGPRKGRRLSKVPAF